MATPATSRTRESGRPCGCDPAADYVCNGHGAHVDETDAVIQNPIGPDIRVSGPDSNAMFLIDYAQGESASIYVERFVLEDIITELQRRLTERA